MWMLPDVAGGDCLPPVVAATQGFGLRGAGALRAATPTAFMRPVIVKATTDTFAPLKLPWERPPVRRYFSPSSDRMVLPRHAKISRKASTALSHNVGWFGVRGSIGGDFSINGKEWGRGRRASTTMAAGAGGRRGTTNPARTFVPAIPSAATASANQEPQAAESEASAASSSSRSQSSATSTTDVPEVESDGTSLRQGSTASSEGEAPLGVDGGSELLEGQARVEDENSIEAAENKQPPELVNAELTDDEERSQASGQEDNGVVAPNSEQENSVAVEVGTPLVGQPFAEAVGTGDEPRNAVVKDAGTESRVGVNPSGSKVSDRAVDVEGSSDANAFASRIMSLAASVGNGAAEKGGGRLQSEKAGARESTQPSDNTRVESTNDVGTGEHSETLETDTTVEDITVPDEIKEDKGTEDGNEEEGKEKWCPRTAMAEACDTEPRLAKAFERFEEAHPGATIIYLAHSGSILYGTETEKSDLDVRGVFIPRVAPPKPEARVDRGKGFVRHRGVRAPERSPVLFDEAFPEEDTFWYSTSDARVRNNAEDIDVDLISLDRFFVQLMRGDVMTLELLFSMLVPKMALIADNAITSVILREKRFMVSRQFGSWQGIVLNHISRYNKLQMKVRALEGTLKMKKQLMLRDRIDRLRTTSSSSKGPASASGPESAESSRTVSTPAATPASELRSESSSGKGMGDEEKRADGRRHPTLVSLSSSSTPSSSTATLEGEDSGSADGAADGAGDEAPRLGVLSRKGKVWFKPNQENPGEDAAEDAQEEVVRDKVAELNLRGGKLLSHAQRAIVEAEQLMRTGTITFPLKPKAVEGLMRLKMSRVHLPAKAASISEKMQSLKTTAQRCALPSYPDRTVLIKVRDEVAKVHRDRPIAEEQTE